MTYRNLPPKRGFNNSREGRIKTIPGAKTPVEIRGKTPKREYEARVMYQPCPWGDRLSSHALFGFLRGVYFVCCAWYTAENFENTEISNMNVGDIYQGIWD